MFLYLIVIKLNTYVIHTHTHKDTHTQIHFSYIFPLIFPFSSYLSSNLSLSLSQTTLFFSRLFEKIAITCEYFRNVFPISFVLGFYVTIVVQRWWEQYMLIPWPDTVCILASTYIEGQVSNMRERERERERLFTFYIIVFI